MEDAEDGIKGLREIGLLECVYYGKLQDPPEYVYERVQRTYHS